MGIFGAERHGWLPGGACNRDKLGRPVARVDASRLAL
jgi:hypothetical protein